MDRTRINAYEPGNLQAPLAVSESAMEGRQYLPVDCGVFLAPAADPDLPADGFQLVRDFLTSTGMNIYSGGGGAE